MDTNCEMPKHECRINDEARMNQLKIRGPVRISSLSEFVSFVFIRG
jgi:hypothetical protein